MSLPAFRALRDRFPQAEISVLARPWVADLYARESWCTRLIPYTGARWRTATQLRGERFDCAILFQNAFDAALLAWLARIPSRIGYNRDARGFLLTTAVAPPQPGDTPAHQRFYYLELLKRAGIINRIPPVTAIRLEGAGDAAAA